MSPIIVLVGLIVAGYIYLFIGGKYYLRENFSASLCPNDKPKTRLILEQNLSAPYTTAPIRDLDDYEYNLVFQNEGDRALTQQQINKMTAQYPLDWAGLPPDAARFQQGQTAMEEKFQDKPKEIYTTGIDPYSVISAQSLTPPDTTQQEMEERKILQTYVPENTKSLTTYDIEDAKRLIEKIYDQKGEIAQFVKRDNNVYEIIGTRRKDEKIVYEDEEAPASRAPVAKAGEATITVPPTAVDVSAGLDPFYTPSTQTRTGRWDYNQWTPGLERMFAPTYPLVKWY